VHRQEPARRFRTDPGALGEGQAGLALTYRGVRFIYTQVWRTPEFYERNRFTQFGVINLTFRY